MSKKPTKPETPVKNPDALTLRREEGKSNETMLARHAISPEFSNMATVKAFTKSQWGGENLHLTELAAQLMSQAETAQKGDLSRAEGMLMIQAHTLDAIFNNLAQRAASAKLMPQLEQYMRLALKAQSQCRATLESLATIKNPPIVYAKQANIANGPQQINNGIQPQRARENEIEQTQLSGGAYELLPDTQKSANAYRVSPTLDALEVVQRAKVTKQ